MSTLPVISSDTTSYTNTMIPQPTHNPVVPLELDSQDIVIEKYSDNSFKVSGNGTRLYTKYLTELGGKYNRNLKGGPGWIFGNKRYESVNNFVDQVSKGLVVPISSSSSLSNNTLTYKKNTTSIPILSSEPSDTQTITYTLVLPSVGRKVQIKVGSNFADYVVAQATPNSSGFVDTAMISSPSNPNQLSKIVIINGKWQVFGYIPEHTINFM